MRYEVLHTTALFQCYAAVIQFIFM